jgi:Calcineurin-like phosphoesterase
MADLTRLRRRISELIDSKELAAAIIHLNDTYRIEQRLPAAPGLPRIASLVEEITTLVRDGAGDDLTLVVHAGDFLSPSLINRVLGEPGRQMTKALNWCGLDYATIGNHEFDLKPDELRRCIANSDFNFVVSNLKAPPDLPKFSAHATWPSSKPFFAICGFAGRQTIDKAVEDKFGFQLIDWKEALRKTIDEIKEQVNIGALIALTHMDRKEDKEFQDELSHLWPRRGFAYVLGGHDHDISWQEHEGKSVLCKNLSNCGTVTVILLTKSGVAALPESLWPPPQYLTMSREDNERVARGEEPNVSVAEVVEQTIGLYQDKVGDHLRLDFRSAFESCIRSTAAQLAPSLVKDGPRALMSWAVGFATDEFRSGNLFVLNSEDDLASLNPEPTFTDEILQTMQAVDRSGGDHLGDAVVAKFEGVPGGRVDALREKAGRWGRVSKCRCSSSRKRRSC